MQEHQEHFLGVKHVIQDIIQSATSNGELLILCSPITLVESYELGNVA